MWFPTIGLIQENSLIKNALRISKDPKENGFIIKYIYKVFTLIRNKPEVFYPMLNYFLLYQNFAAYNKFIISPYLEWLGYRYDNYYSKNQAKTTELINKFRDFVFVMTQYCYNWKQIQDSLRLSLENVVDGIKLIDSEFKDICLFILSHNLKDEFKGVVATKIETNPNPISKITVVFAKEMTTSSEDPSVINEHLHKIGAINYNLLIEPISPDTSEEDIKAAITPYYNTMFLGKNFSISGGKLKKKTKKYRAFKLKKKTKKNKCKKSKKNKKH